MSKLDTIKNLLRKASDPGATAEESETYNEKARDLMARHGIEVAMLAESGAQSDDIVQREYRFTDPYSGSKATLLARIAYPMRCQSVMWGGNGRAQKMVVVGYESDIERVDVLYGSLLLQMTGQLAEVRPPVYSDDSTRSYRLSWLQGFADQVWRRLREAESSAVRDAEASGSTGTELVLVSRTERVAERYGELFPGVGKAKKRSLKGSGYGAGTRAGASADLGGNRLGGQRTSIGG